MTKKIATELNEESVRKILKKTAKIFTGIEYVRMLSLLLIFIEDALKGVPDPKSRSGFYEWLIQELNKQKEQINCGSTVKITPMEKFLFEEWDAIETPDILCDQGKIVTLPKKAKICEVVTINGRSWIAKALDPVSERKFIWKRIPI